MPETPSPEVLTVSKPDIQLGRRMHMAAAGRNVDADSPAKGRVSKAPRTGLMAPPAAGEHKNAYLAVCTQARELCLLVGAAAGSEELTGCIGV